jgi:hypothetical protein
MEEKKYGIHPSTELQKLFYDKPYQGQNPKQAKVIIVGLDANYHKDLENYADSFKLVKEYHADGVKFWHSHSSEEGIKVHHPFLDKNYPISELRDGVGYHKNVKKALGNEYKDEYAECICFIELLGVPTFGVTKNKEFWDIFRKTNGQEHAEKLESIISHKSDYPKLILVCEKVIDIMRQIKKDYGYFKMIPNHPVLFGWSTTIQGNIITKRKSFSPAASQTNEQLKVTGQLIVDFCHGKSTL